MTLGEAESRLVDFLEECAQIKGAEARARCPVCDAPRSFHCSSCFQLVVPKETIPNVISEHLLKLPFEIDIILDDRRASSTGVQVATLLSHQAIRGEDETPNSSEPKSQVRLFDHGEGEALPDYSKEQNTFLLFPGGNSIPLSSVAMTTGIEKLVVLDCKWARSSVRLHKSVQSMQRVHLDHSFKQSYYWRWHTAGEGMISTVEAIYLSAWEVAEAKQWPPEEKSNLVYLLWLFGLQREIIRCKHEQSCTTRPAPLPFTEDGKEHQRELRRRKDNELLQEQSVASPL